MWKILWFLSVVGENCRVSAEYYSLGGTGNNRNNDGWGATGTTFRRVNDEIDFVTFADGIGVGVHILTKHIYI